MAEEVNGAEFFHVVSNWSHSPYPPLAVGQTLIIGKSPNAFFGWYEKPRTLPLTLADGTNIEIPAMKWLNEVRAGRITPGDLPQAAYQIAEHFQILSRELITERVRLEEAPSAPSRLSCLWLASSHADALKWRAAINRQASIARLSLTGVIAVVDAIHLSGDAEAYSSIVQRARDYWRGSMSQSPQPEVLFSGVAEVLEVIA